MSGRHLKVQSQIRIRVSTPLKTQLLKWSARAGLSETDFLRFALVLGSRTLALDLGLHRDGDDLEMDEIADFRFRGAERPAEMQKNGSKHYINPSGRIPSDEEFEAAQAARKARVKQK